MKTITVPKIVKTKTGYEIDGTLTLDCYSKSQYFAVTKNTIAWDFHNKYAVTHLGTGVMIDSWPTRNAAKYFIRLAESRLPKAALQTDQYTVLQAEIDILRECRKQTHETTR